MKKRIGTLHGPVCMELGETLREMRHQRGLTQEGLADRVNYTRSYIAHIERCYGTPLDAIVRILAFYGCELQ